MLRRRKVKSKTILSTHQTKDHAFIAEALMIRSNYGNPRLLNISRGHVMKLPNWGNDSGEIEYEI